MGPKFVKLIVVWKPGDTAVIKSILDGSEIPYYINNENMSTLGEGIAKLTNMEVMVEESKFNEAKGLLKDFFK